MTSLLCNGDGMKTTRKATNETNENAGAMYLYMYMCDCVQILRIYNIRSICVSIVRNRCTPRAHSRTHTRAHTHTHTQVFSRVAATNFPPQTVTLHGVLRFCCLMVLAPAKERTCVFVKVVRESRKRQ